MFGKKAAKEQGKLAQQQQAQTTQLIQQAQTKSPLELQREQEQLDWTRDTTSPSFDVTKTAALNPYLSLYQNAVANRNEDMAGTGILRLGTNQQNPNTAASLNRLLDERRRESAGGALAQAFAAKDAEMRGSLMPLLGLQNSRNVAVAGISSNNSNDAWRRYLQANQSAGFLNSNLFNQIMAGARTAATMGGGGAP